MAGHDAAAWSDFGVGVIGASAALTGRLFVAVSINLERILSFPTLPARAGQTLGFFAAPVFLSMLLLVPQSSAALGWELVALGVLSGLLLLGLSRSSTDQEKAPSYLLGRLTPSVVFAAAIVVAGLTLVTGGPGGLLWLVSAVAAALLAGLTNVWVLRVRRRRDGAAAHLRGGCWPRHDHQRRCRDGRPPAPRPPGGAVTGRPPYWESGAGRRSRRRPPRPATGPRVRREE